MAHLEFKVQGNWMLIDYKSDIGDREPCHYDFAKIVVQQEGCQKDAEMIARAGFLYEAMCKAMKEIDTSGYKPFSNPVPVVQLAQPAAAMPAVAWPTTAPELLNAASAAQADRAVEYDKEATAERSMVDIVRVFNAYFPDKQLTEAQGWLFMRILKDIRLLNAPNFHTDSAVDGVSYQSLFGEAIHEDRSR